MSNLPANYNEKDQFYAFERVAHQESNGAILKYSKGDWTANDAEINGVILTANMIDLCHGWRKWVDKKIVATDIGFVRDNFVPKQRNDLDDLDETKWPVSQNGEPSDPWSWAYYLRLTDDDGSTYVWAASSAGARGAIGDLANKFSRKRVNPIVKLSSGSYKHAQFGKVLVPVLEIVGWDEGRPPFAPPAPVTPLPSPEPAGMRAIPDFADSDIPF
jgi:hypothetical protein